MKEQFCTMILSYYRFFGADVAEMLETFNEVEQRRILHTFMDIIEGDLWRECDNTVVIDVELDEEIKQPVKLFVNLYCLDQMAEKAIDIVKRTFNKEENGNEA